LTGKLAAIMKLTRIEHSIMLVIAVIAAELITGSLPSLFILAMSLITPIFISMSSFAINDYFDIEVDRLNNKTKRPLVNGSLKPRDAVIIAIVCLIIGIGASLLINWYCFAIALVFGSLAMLYSYKLKEKLFWGNAYIAFSMAIPFIFGNYVISYNLRFSIILISLIIFLSGLAREIHGTIRDLKGDTKARNANTIPKVIGVKASALASLVLYVIAIIISLYLFFALEPFEYSITYIVLITVTDIMLLYVGLKYVYVHTDAFYKSTRNISLVAMSIALIAFLLTPLIPLAYI